MTNADKSRRDGIFIRFRTAVVFPPDEKQCFYCARWKHLTPPEWEFSEERIKKPSEGHFKKEVQEILHNPLSFGEGWDEAIKVQYFVCPI